MEREHGMDIREMKKKLRKEAIAQALSLPETCRKEADARIVCRLLELPEYKNADTVFCFVGVEHEIDTRPFLQRVLDDGKRLAVPLCTGKKTMEAKRIHSLDALKRGNYGLYEPDPSSETIPMEQIGFAVIPCLAADRQGNRLGHGGGYYDALFHQYPNTPAAIVCRERLIRECIPLEPFDHRFSITVTEAGVFRAE